jgi:hypothetical protein
MNRVLILALGSFFLMAACDGKDVCDIVPALCDPDGDGTPKTPEQIISSLENTYDSLMGVFECDTLTDDSAEWLKETCKYEDPKTLKDALELLLVRSKELIEAKGEASPEEYEAGLNCIEEVKDLIVKFEDITEPNSEDVQNIIAKAQACLSIWVEFMD